MLFSQVGGRWHRQGSRGFTLLEVLVVLVLLSLVSGALFEGLSFTLKIRQGILGQMDRQRSGVLQSFWIRSVISGTQPISLPRKGEFVGQPEVISGTSNGTLGGIPGSPGVYSLELKKKDNVLTLNYSDQYGSEFILGQWPGAEGKFLFVHKVLQKRTLFYQLYKFDVSYQKYCKIIH